MNDVSFTNQVPQKAFGRANVNTSAAFRDLFCFELDVIGLQRISQSVISPKDQHLYRVSRKCHSILESVLSARTSMRLLSSSLPFVAVVFSIQLCLVSTDSEPRIWALLVAGSNGYYNYRHQADVCHAYQILHKNGVPDERIVVMMYDDIANR